MPRRADIPITMISVTFLVAGRGGGLMTRLGGSISLITFLGSSLPGNPASFPDLKVLTQLPSTGSTSP
ncbi:MAG: hypothetical protein OK404_03015, partial [Thaumarchaeota archaeon]|nr:hypothetical protein [Nitrososphaerota archaeon]